MLLRNNTKILIPLMFSFFVMGFVDVIGVTTNFVKEDFALSDSVANLFPSSVFLWFLLLSVPIGLWMNRTGCRKILALGGIVTSLALLLPYVAEGVLGVLASFCLLGIGNTLIQVSINPLAACVFTGKRLAGALTFGQFMKAMASFLGPVLAAWVIVITGHWQSLFLGLSVMAFLVAISLLLVSVSEEKRLRSSSFKQCAFLLKDKFILLLFVGIVCHVGMDVGINVTLPKIFVERLHCAVGEAGYSSSVYFLFRTIGCLGGAFLLVRCSARRFFLISLMCLGIGILGMLFSGQALVLYISIVFLGLGNSNVFSLIMSQALLHRSDARNEVSGLMVMGLVGGAIFPLLMGAFSDVVGAQWGAVLILCMGLAYLMYVGVRMRD